MNKRTKAKASSDGEDPGGILAAFMMNKRIKIEDSSDGEDTGDIVHVPDVEDSMPVDTKLEEPRARSTSRIGIRAKTTAPVASNGDSATRSDEEYMATSSDEEDMATSSDEEDTKPRQRTNPGSGSIHATSRRTGLRNSRTVQPAPMPSNQVRSAARPTKSRTKAARSTSKRAVDLSGRRDIEKERRLRLRDLIDEDIMEGAETEPFNTTAGKMYKAVLLTMERIGYVKGGGTSTDTAGGKKKTTSSDNGDDNDSSNLDEVAGLRAEKEALTETVAGLRAEKEALAETVAGLRAEEEALTETLSMAWERLGSVLM